MRRSAGLATALTLIAMAVAGVGASSASAFGITKWEAGTCTTGTCTYAGAPAEFFTQAAGHPNFGVTDFTVKGESGNQPKRVKVELPAGLNVNPQAVPQCSEADFRADACSAASEVGVSEVTTGEIAVVPPLVNVPPIGPLSFPVYDLTPKDRPTGPFRLPRHPQSSDPRTGGQRVRLPRNGDRMGRRLPRVVLHQRHRRIPAARPEPSGLQRSRRRRQLPHPAQPLQRQLDQHPRSRRQRRGHLRPGADHPAGGDLRLPESAVRADRVGERRHDHRHLGDDLGLAERPAASDRHRTQHLDGEERQRDPAGRRRPQPGDRARPQVLPRQKPSR